MRRYLGSKMTAFAAIVMPLFIVTPLVFSVFALVSEISGATLFLSLMGLCCSIVWIIYLKKVENQLYSWGVFERDRVRTKCFSKRQSIYYDKIRGCGIAYYVHGVLGSNIGTKVYFIFLSEDIFDEQYRTRINLWKPSQSQVKVEYDQKLYEYLLTVLPNKQANSMRHDYEKYLVTKQN